MTGDIRLALRMLRKSPGFTAVAVLVLGLGIGANTAIFSVINVALLRSLPYGEPDRLVMIWEKRIKEGMDAGHVSPADFLDWREQNTAFERMSSFLPATLNLAGQEGAERVEAGAVTWEFFATLGVSVARGRNFLPGEEQAGKNLVMILSHGLWQRRFGGDPRILGKTVIAEGAPFTVIGVLPESWRFPERELELWIPAGFGPGARENRASHMLKVFARLKPGVSLDRARAEMTTLAGRLEQANPQVNTGHSANVVPLREQLVGEIRPALIALLAAVGFVLLIACANVANLFLARAIGREREMAVRRAMGAAPARLIRQLLTESLVLAGAGGAFGLMLATWGVDAIRLLIPPSYNIPGIADIRVDSSMLWFTFGLSMLTGLLFGLAPALQSTRGDLSTALKEGSRATARGGRRRLSRLLVASEVALSMMLLAGAGLMIRSVIHLRNVEPGFDSNNVLAVQVSLARGKYREPVQRAAFFRDLCERTRSLPGVVSAGATFGLPFAGEVGRSGFGIEGRPATPGEPRRAHGRIVTAGYFETMRIPLKAGRLPSPSDTRESPLVVWINETAAARFFPGENPIGRRVAIGGFEGWREIAGVVGDVKFWGLDNRVNPEAYMAFEQVPMGAMNLVLRTSGDPVALAGAVRAQVQALDKDQPVGAIRTMEDYISRSIATRRFYMLLLGLFAGLALVLAAGGIFSVMSYAVTERTNEIGLRMALGAEARDVIGMVLRQGMTLVGAGLAVGLAGSYAATRLLEKLLFGVEATDPGTFVSVAALLALVALAANWIPAKRATKVDPVVALRNE